MCLAMPGRVIDVPKPNTAVLDFVGITREAHVGLVGEVQVGDFLLVHAGCAIARLDEAGDFGSVAMWEELIRYAASS